MIVFDDADLEAAAETIAECGYFNAGQDCTAACRVLGRRRGSTTTSWAGLAEQAGGLVMGDTTAPETTLGPLISGSPARAGRGVPRAQAVGNAEIVTGGSEPDLPRLLPRADRGREPQLRTTR